jgi:hypothetical protein
MWTRWATIAAVSVLAACVPNAGMDALAGDKQQDAKFTYAEFQELHQELQMPKNGMWTIPWKISIQEARELAVKTGKPIHLWAQDGHPLGVC